MTNGTVAQSPAASVLQGQDFGFLHEGPPTDEPLPDLAAVLSDIREAVSAIVAGRLVKLVLYGSRARGDWDLSSDVDLAAVVNGLSREEHQSIINAVCEIEVRHLFPVSFLVFSTERFEELKSRERRIALDIEREGVPL